MSSNKNIYNYQTPKSSNEDTSFFNTKGRINRVAFFARLFLVILIYSISFFIFNSGIHKLFGFRIEIFFETIHFYLLPFFLLLFVLIQGAKRIHDVDKSGWYIFIPFYNLFIILSPGTKGNNNYGIDFNFKQDITYFDELDPKNSNKKNIIKLNNYINKDYLFNVLKVAVFVFIIGFIVVKSKKDVNNFSNINITSKYYDSNINNSNVIVKNKKETKIDNEIVDSSLLINYNIENEYQDISDRYIEEKRDLHTAKDVANVFWNKKYTL
jgi:uncharacterized membrane protein YhaH (DUF805 family)